MLIVSILPVKNWTQWMVDPTIADSIVDRLESKAERVELAGESLRKKLSQVNKDKAGKKNAEEE